MLNFHVNFAHPWLWLLLLPAVACALIPYFRISKKYRRNRNRIVSLCLHIAVVTFCTAALVNTTFDYEVYNPSNEILLVVDASYSTETEKTAKDDYVRDFVAMADTRVFKIGAVTEEIGRSRMIYGNFIFNHTVQLYIKSPIVIFVVS